MTVYVHLKIAYLVAFAMFYTSHRFYSNHIVASLVLTVLYIMQSSAIVELMFWLISFMYSKNISGPKLCSVGFLI